jgi:hypothetical protein
MNKTTGLVRCLFSAAALLTPTGGLLAQQQQQQPPPRLDNQWGGFSHQPTESNVQQQEKAAGIAPSEQQRKAADQDVEQLYQSLMKNAPAGNGSSQ